MTEQDKKRLEELRNKNQKYIHYKTLQEHTLLQECLSSLGTKGKIIDELNHIEIYTRFSQEVPFSINGLNPSLDSHIFKIYSSMDEKLIELYDHIINEYFYIIWGKDLYIIECDIRTILENIYDIICVSPDTWLLSVDFLEVIEFFHEGIITYCRLKN